MKIRYHIQCITSMEFYCKILQDKTLIGSGTLNYGKVWFARLTSMFNGPARDITSTVFDRRFLIPASAQPPPQLINWFNDEYIVPGGRGPRSLVCPLNVVHYHKRSLLVSQHIPTYLNTVSRHAAVEFGARLFLLRQIRWIVHNCACVLEVPISGCSF